MIDSLHKLFRDFRGIADFLTVYILEAHAVDEWPLGTSVEIKQHRVLEERISAAELFIRDYEYKLPLVIDSIDNSFNSIFAAWPERFYIAHNNKLAYIAQPGPNGQNTEMWHVEVRNWLAAYTESCLEE